MAEKCLGRSHKRESLEEGKRKPEWIESSLFFLFFLRKKKLLPPLCLLPEHICASQKKKTVASIVTSSVMTLSPSFTLLPSFLETGHVGSYQRGKPLPQRHRLHPPGETAQPARGESAGTSQKHTAVTFSPFLKDKKLTPPPMVPPQHTSLLWNTLNTAFPTQVTPVQPGEKTLIPPNPSGFCYMHRGGALAQEAPCCKHNAETRSAFLSTHLFKQQMERLTLQPQLPVLTRDNVSWFLSQKGKKEKETLIFIFERGVP